MEDCSTNWKSKRKKSIINSNLCVDNCSSISYYEYNSQCYLNCPEGTNPSEKDLYLCETNNKNVEKENVISTNINDDNIYEKIEDKYILNYFKIYQDYANYIINKIKKGNFDYIISDIINNSKSYYFINYKNIQFQITTLNNQKKIIYSNLSKVIIEEECENILRDHYAINQNETIIIFKYNYLIEGLKIPLIGYKLFHPVTKIELDLNYCTKKNIGLSIPVLIDEEKEYKYNPKSDYYNDICKNYKNNNNYDITISDRKREYNYKNLSLCPYNCSFSKYNLTTKNVLCQCEPQVEMPLLIFEDIINMDKLLNNFLDIKSISNIEIFKCYNRIFSKDGLKANVGSYIIITIILFFIVFYIIFYVKGYNDLINIIDAIIKNKFEENNNIVKNKQIEENKDNKNNKVSVKKKIIKVKKKISNLITSNKKSSLAESINSNYFLNIDDKNSCIQNINLDKSRTKKSQNINKINYIDYDLNNFSYEEALKNDKRSFLQYYISLISSKHLLFFSFYPLKDYNSQYLKICFFFNSFGLFYFINSLFFTDSTMHKIYEDKGIFNFIYLFPIMIYSSIISSIINLIVRNLCLSENNIRKIKNENNLEKAVKDSPNIKKFLKIKFILFFIICFLLLVIFWYYLAGFNAVYKNTQIYLLKHFLISFSISMIYPFIIFLLPSILRIAILKYPQYYYKLSKLTQSL